MDNSQKSESKWSEHLRQEDQAPRQVPQAERSQSREAQFSELPEETKLSAEKLVAGQELSQPSRPSEPLPPQTPDPQPSSTGMQVDEILSSAKTAGPQHAPQIHVAKAQQEQASRIIQELQKQKQIPVELQTESIAKKVCKLKGHWIEPMVVRSSSPVPDEPGTPQPWHETTVVICRQCGASLIQIRG